MLTDVTAEATQRVTHSVGFAHPTMTLPTLVPMPGAVPDVDGPLVYAVPVDDGLLQPRARHDLARAGALSAFDARPATAGVRRRRSIQSGIAVKARHQGGASAVPVEETRGSPQFNHPLRRPMAAQRAEEVLIAEQGVEQLPLNQFAKVRPTGPRSRRTPGNPVGDGRSSQ